MKNEIHSRIGINNVVAAIVVFTCLAVNAATGFTALAAPSPSQGVESDKKQMAQALLLLQGKKHQESLSLLLPLYDRAPYRLETFFASKDLPEDFVPPGVELKLTYTPAELLLAALRDTHRFPQAAALGSALHYHYFKAPLDPAKPFAFRFYPDRMKKWKNERYAPAVAVNDLWLNSKVEPLVKEGAVFVPLADFIRAAQLESVPQADKSLIGLRQKNPARQFVFKVGEREVTTGDNSKMAMKHAPFAQGESVIVAADDMASLLKAKVYSFPDVMVTHLTFPNEDDKK